MVLQNMPPFQKKPTITVLCGSTRFKQDFERVNWDLTLKGEIVLGPGVYVYQNSNITPEQKTQLDYLHKRKIELADRVLVVNVAGYIGESTRHEINYAEFLGKPIEYLVKDVNGGN